MLRTLAVLVALVPAFALADIAGQASVIDGDTIPDIGEIVPATTGTSENLRSPGSRLLTKADIAAENSGRRARAEC